MTFEREYKGPTACEPEFFNLAESYDILCLTETWHSNKNDLLNKNKFLSLEI